MLKMLKTMGHITLFINHYSRNGYIGDTDPPLWYVMLNQINEYLHNFDSGLYWNHVATSYQEGCIDKSGLKQRNTHEQGNQTRSSVST